MRPPLPPLQLARVGERVVASFVGGGAPAPVRFFAEDPTGRLRPLRAFREGDGWSAAVPPATPVRAVATRGTDRVAETLPRGDTATASTPKPAPSAPLGPPARFLAHVSVQLAQPEVVGETPEGLRINYYLAGGTVSGPGLNAVVEPKGGDWMLIRRDGVGVPHIRAVLRLPDGSIALTEYSGTFDLGANGYADALRGAFPPAPPLALAPRFSTASNEFGWLNRVQCVGTGHVVMATSRVEYDLFALTPSPGDT